MFYNTINISISGCTRKIVDFPIQDSTPLQEAFNIKDFINNLDEVKDFTNLTDDIPHFTDTKKRKRNKKRKCTKQ